MKINYNSSRLEQVQIFSDEELIRLRRLASENPLSELASNPKWIEESGIDFSYSSSQIEGNTYTRAETINLLKKGVTAGEKPFSDAVMILNLRETYNYITKHSIEILNDPLREIKRYHSMLMANILSSSELGATRKMRGVMIGGSNYQPLSGEGPLNGEMNRLIKILSSIDDPFDKCLYAASNIAYLQYFEDGNKRTSRVAQNAILMANGLPPVLIEAQSVNDYIEGTIDYYESGDHIQNRQVMLNAYERCYGEQADEKNSNSLQNNRPAN
jgi:Fic family protein